ncbi:SprT-like domain-containing protein [Spirosoma terrae]|uniref:SprT family zinc-dependent metalloprotease n=1 Tax=Spirosoma terrae TaxID=1968276 RepID=A0A6L9KZA9_9BACT|nr:SprT family zinc-dependent metalloprotease [Spirosoma terrae]NDU93380.1 SprT family zinc-dependent metalloprotease [Spirosoma terrae]
MTDVFTTYFPAGASNYCRQLWETYNFDFHIVKPRRTRLGDFRAFPSGKTQITVNQDLNPYAFLITYVHEVAHADVNCTYKKRIQPHGKAWQSAFQRLMQPLLAEPIFPEEIVVPLQRYMTKPAATTYANPDLMAALRKVDVLWKVNTDSNAILLRDVIEGEMFQFDKKTFIRGTLRRTRIVCKEMSSGKSYAILAHAWVQKSCD